MSNSAVEPDAPRTRRFGSGTNLTDREPASRNVEQAVWMVIGAAVALFWLISTSWRPWELFDRAGFSADFYDEQARSFIRGRLAVRPEVPGPEGFLIDGKTYLYYGPFLAIVRMPLALFGDLFVGRMVRVSMLVALVVLGRWSARLARSGRRLVIGRVDDAASDRWPVALFVGAVLFSPALFASGWISVYHETEIWALALAVIALTLLVEWLASGRTDRRLLRWGSAAVLATTLTRAPIGLGLAFGLGLVGLGLLWRSRTDETGQQRTVGWLAVAGGVVPLVAYAAVNLAKFGTPFSVPGDKQVQSLTDPTRAAFFEATGGSFFSTSFLPTTIAQYLRPDTIRFERFVPGVRFGPLAENYGTLDVETVTPASSLTISATLLMLLAVIGVGWLIVNRAHAWLLLLVGAVVAAIPTFLIGFIANRYLIDMLPALILPSAAAVWIVATLEPRRVVRVVGAVLLVWGAWVNVALATWTKELKSPGFTELRSDVDAVFFSGDVGIVGADPDGTVPRDGIVGIVGSEEFCSGVYIAEQGRWVALERAPGVFEQQGTLDTFDSRTVTLAGTAAWSLEVVSLEAGGIAVVFATPEDADAFSVAVDVELPVDYLIVTDPISNEATMRIGDVEFLLPGSAPDGALPSGIAPGGVRGSADSSLCAELARRRENPPVLLDG